MIYNLFLLLHIEKMKETDIIIRKLIYIVKHKIKNTMNKADLINKIAEKAGLSKVDSKKALDAFVESIKESLNAGDKVSLVGFGTFSVSERGARTGVNPSTGKQMTIPAKKVCKFKAGSELADAVK